MSRKMFTVYQKVDHTKYMNYFQDEKSQQLQQKSHWIMKVADKLSKIYDPMEICHSEDGFWCFNLILIFFLDFDQPFLHSEAL